MLSTDGVYCGFVRFMGFTVMSSVCDVCYDVISL